LYSLPAGHKQIEILSDPKKIPLIFASDIVVGETSMYADYIFPDLTYLERWEFPGSHPSVTPKVGAGAAAGFATPGGDGDYVRRKDAHLGGILAPGFSRADQAAGLR
jgi:hypothetical protein